MVSTVLAVSLPMLLIESVNYYTMQKVAVDRDSRQQYQLCRQPLGNFRIGLQHM